MAPRKRTTVGEKATKEEVQAPVEVVQSENPNTVVPTSIAELSVDYGREDLNNIAKKINEIIKHLNG